jgi:hypothetical protein
MLSIAKSDIEEMSRRRSMRPVSAVSKGELVAYASAKIETRRPAFATETRMSAAIMVRSAAIMKPSVPMANVPSASQ